ncbi:tRNA uridine(34) 5-carboxymethylaminomethyl modification radical SAM/GNAT enzyme Elp3 [Candidatus Micrarchaeota archaeon]|nr:tRNA uridine(34) 5-carboxymethylaminomethyl modification radical SAM/GNAT enzyme Elp3 [Candidatus Micrarchaeota archaeon]MBU1930368.1 tRNA uridine(34) 5-carboxymethylaminomethyl modification radical SAM/GNAT enzyme Elp3 [Candidatus Micrarchaeota archaeon]
MEKKQLFAQSLIQKIEAKEINSVGELNKAKIRLAGKIGLNQLPPNPTILSFAKNPSLRTKQLLGIKPVRTISGVAPLAIMAKPIDCAHGTCIFCPGGEKSFFGSIPKSYTGHEPASMRAQSNQFDPYLQSFNRLYQFAATNHNLQKIELIVMGGTFPSFPKTYRHSFVAGAFKALNDFSDLFFAPSGFDFKKFNAFFDPKKFEYKKQPISFQKKLLHQKGKPVLKKEQKKNETGSVRMVTFCVETKPDYCKQKHINDLLDLGVTRVELGVQALDDNLLSFSNRGHSVQDSVMATQHLKDSALKVTYHMMPGLPHSTSEKDIGMFRELFENSDFCPDALKIYPCMVLPGTPLYKQYQKGLFSPLTTKQAARIIAKAKRFFPPWVRIQRIMRDIPTQFAIKGVQHNNLRQFVKQKALELGIECQCIRCREAGHLQQKKSFQLKPNNATIQTIKYEASKGMEIFISAEDLKENALFGFCRLRIPFKPFRKEITSSSALVRELHVFGEPLLLGQKKKDSIQHKGLGKQLLQKAEEIAKNEFSKRKIVVIAGIGAREYYRKQDYILKGPFMEKTL